MPDDRILRLEIELREAKGLAQVYREERNEAVDSAEEGWRTVLHLAVQYGAKASEKAARNALKDLEVDA